MLKHQQASFRKILTHVWRHSPFYREYYRSHGIKESDLPDVGVEDLPFLTKGLLMENFDRALCDTRLRKTDLEQWIQDNPDPAQNYKRDFIVVHSSGSSGNIGIFVYDSGAWRLANACMAGLFPTPTNLGRTKIAFYIASHGHFAGVTVASRIPQVNFEVLILSLLDSSEQALRRLNAFQPDRLVGYSSSIVPLADMALHNKLDIHPASIFVTGDLLTPDMEETIRRAWDVPLYVQYSASESMYIAFKNAREEEMAVITDLNIVEILGEDNRGVQPGREGRIVLTNLYNHTLPVLRYELADRAVRGVDREGSLPTIREIKGRVNQPLPVVLENGSRDTISPHVLGEFYVPGLEKMQYISRSPADVEIRYVAPFEMDSSVRNEFQRILNMKRASGTTFEVRRVTRIEIDPQTGKFALVKLQDSPPYRASGIETSAKEESIPTERRASDVFCEFTDNEIQRSIPARFEQMAADFAGRTAIRTPTSSLTYRELNASANRLAGAILTNRETRQEPVVLVLGHDANAIVGVMGVLKAAKICVPLDPTYPAARIQYVIGDTGANLIVTDNQNLALATEALTATCELVNIDRLDPKLSGENPGIPVAANDLAYVLYSSGSTGRPKGIMHSHRDLLHAVMASGNPCRYSPTDRISLFATISSAHGGMTIFSALLYGAALYLWSIRQQGFADLARWLMAEEITVYLSSPTVFRNFAATLSERDSLPNLRLIRVGSEPLKKTDVELYKKHFSSDCVLVHILASAEAMHIANYFIDKNTDIDDAIVPVGFPVEGKTVLILDENGRELGPLKTGEIAVKSDYLFPGYWRNSELTESVLLPDPEGGSGKIYRTGDLGRVSSDGCLTFLGRKDFRVKIRGYSVELTEIETALLEHPPVKEAVVVASGDDDQEKRLVAYVAPKPGEKVNVAELRNSVKARLPDYMVPAAFVTLDALPVNANGKVERQALPPPDTAALDPERPFVAPRTPMEKALADIWREILGVERVGIHDNFFDLGGHSLLAMQVISRVHDIFGIDLPLTSLLTKPTLAEVAIAVVETQAEHSRQGKLGETLAGLEQLTEEEALRLLADGKHQLNR
jgi:amino acid adenylation domain-containing protein